MGYKKNIHHKHNVLFHFLGNILGYIEVLFVEKKICDEPAQTHRLIRIVSVCGCICLKTGSLTMQLSGQNLVEKN